MLQIIIDTHEDRGHDTFLNHMTMQYKRKQLDIGDILLMKDNEEMMIIERKTLEDYAASIKDGRNKEQPIRLAASGLHRAQCVYLIEGNLPRDPTAKIAGIPVGAIKTSIANKMIKFGFSVFYSRDSAETAEIIERIARSMGKEPYYYSQLKKPSGLIGGSYTQAIHRKKKANMTPRISYIAQLNCIPGVSVKIAEKIAEKYPNMATLIIAYSKSQDRAKMLFEIDGIGKILSERIYSYICLGK